MPTNLKHTFSIAVICLNTDEKEPSKVFGQWVNNEDVMAHQARVRGIQARQQVDYIRNRNNKIMGRIRGKVDLAKGRVVHKKKVEAEKQRMADYIGLGTMKHHFAAARDRNNFPSRSPQISSLKYVVH